MERLASIGAISLLLCCVALPESAHAQGGPKQAQARDKAAAKNVATKKDASAAPAASFPCYGQPATSIKPTQYALGLSRKSDLVGLGRDPRSFDGLVVLFIKDDRQQIYPLAPNPNRTGPKYFAFCGPEVPLEVALEGPVVARIALRRSQTSEGLLAALQTALGDATNDLHSWQTVPFRKVASGTNFLDWPEKYRERIPAAGMVPELIKDYVAAGERTLLVGESDNIAFRLGNEIVKWPAATNPTAKRNEPERQGARTAPSTTPSSTPPLPRNAQFAIGFRNKERWRDLKLDEMQRLSTYGYCENSITRTEDGYSLMCHPGPDGKVPIGIRGFQPVFVSQSEAREIDLKLDVVAFRSPYPAAWARPSAFAEIPGGTLTQVLQSQLPLDQAIPGAPLCTATAQISVAAIVEQRFEFPDPPCRAYEVEFGQELADNSARVLSSCLAGAQDPRPISNGRAQCWWQTRTQPLPVTLRVQLLSGFEPVGLTLTRDMMESGTIRPTFAELSDRLVPVWPYRRPTLLTGAADSELPRFVVRTVEYLSCAQGIRTGADGPLPSLKAAGCQAVPTKARIQLEQDTSASGGPPPLAFQPSYPDEYDIRSAAGARTIEVDALKRSLPIRFAPQKIAEYGQRFRSGPAGRTPATAVHVFNGSGEQRCGAPRDGQLISFANAATQAVFKWPLMAAVYDSTSSEPKKLTICSPAKIEEAEGQAYLTFDLEPVLASGPRRVVIVANSQTFQRSVGLRDALRKLVETTETEYRARAPLSPISVYSMDNQENLREVFTGELAARKPAEARQKITADIDTVAPKTPDLKFLKIQPELKNVERLTIVMDGSSVSDDNRGALFIWATDLDRAGGDIKFFITASCSGWPVDLKGFKCAQFSQNDLTRALTELVSRSETVSDARQQTEPVNQGQQHGGGRAK